MAIGITAGLTALSSKLLALLKAGKISATAAKAAMAAAKAKKAGTVLGTTGNVLHKAVPFTRGSAGTRMANPGWVKNMINRAGYDGVGDVLGSYGLDALFAGGAALAQPGDLGDKAIAGGTVLVTGGLGGGLGRVALNSGRNLRIARAAEQGMARAKAKGNYGRYFELQDIANKQRGIYGNKNKIELPISLGGGIASYDISEELMRKKDALLGGPGLSPTEKLYADQDERMQEELLAAYEMGQASALRGGAFYDPYTGDVPLGGYNGYSA